VHLGAYFEWTGSTSTMKKYYSAGGARVAVRTGSSTLSFILTDHLGSTGVSTESSGALSRSRYWLSEQIGDYKRKLTTIMDLSTCP